MKDKKFRFEQIKTIQGGKDPLKIINELILRLGFDPASVLAESDESRQRWLIPLSDSEDVEIIYDSIRIPQDATIYIGVNICTVPLRKVAETLVVALELADGLVHAKISLVGRYLVLSATVPAYSTSLEEIEYFYRLVIAQRNWFLSILSEELDLEVIHSD